METGATAVALADVTAETAARTSGSAPEESSNGANGIKQAVIRHKDP